MKWEIYKQLKPVEREYYDKEIVNKIPLFNLDIQNLIWFSFLQILILAFTALIGMGLKKDVTLLLNLLGTLQKFMFFWMVIFTLIGLIFILFNSVSQKQWLKELGYEVTRRK